MTHDYKAALDWYIRYFTGIYGGYIPSLPHHDAVQESLTLATESEQLRKERDEYKQVLDGAKEYAVELLHSAFHDISTPNDALEYAEILIDHLKEKVNENGK